MKPTDLRIGNIVQLKDSCTPVIVCALTKHKIGFHAPNERPNAHLRYRRYSEIEGVLIYDHWREIEIWRCGLMHSGWDDGDEKYLYYLPVYPCRTVRYIHELQNLHHALTGEELAIDL